MFLNYQCWDRNANGGDAGEVFLPAGCCVGEWADDLHCLVVDNVEIRGAVGKSQR